MSDQDKRSQRDLEPAPPRFSYPGGPSNIRPEISSPVTANPPPHLPPHHHHHRHLSSGSGDRDRPPPPSSSAADSRVPGPGLSSSYPARHDPSGPPGSAASRSGMFGGPKYPYSAYVSEKRERDRLREIERDRELARQGQPLKPGGPPGSGPASGPPPPGSDPYADMRDRERLRDMERDRQQKAGPPGPEHSPGRATSSAAAAYARPGPTTSPTLARREPPPPPSAGGKPPSGSLPPTPSSASASRPGLPPFSALGSRPMAPGYEGGRARSGSNASQTSKDVPAGHQRTLSTSSQPRESLTGLSSLGQTSPIKTNAPPPSTAARSGLFGGPPPLSQAPRDVPPPQRSPIQPPGSVTASPTQSTREAGPPPGSAKPGNPGGAGGSTTSTSHSARPPYSFSSTYASAYTTPYNSYGMGGGFLGSGGAYPFRGYDGATERERREQREREREKERESQFERERAKASEIERERQALREREQAQADKDRMARIERERQLQRERDHARMHEAEQHKAAIAGVEGKAFQPPRQSSTPYGDMYRPRPPAAAPAAPEPKYTRHIEVLNQPSGQSQPYPVEPPAAKVAPAPPPVAAAPAPPSASQRATPAPAPAAPERPSSTQPPYQYTPKPETREYTYTPREKRPRMDAAVEEAAPSNNSASKSRTTTSRKRKKEEPKAEKKDLSALAVAVKKWPEVSSVPVQTYVKTLEDPNRVIAREVYAGSEWSLARTRFTRPEYEGGLVIVRISGACLGSRWKVRGEPGWDEASSAGGDGAKVGLEWDANGKARQERRIWGTDVYTDDSDLGLVLIHAGWLRWGGPETRSDSDLVNVSVRIVPSLSRYYATERNGVITRAWGNGHDGASIVVESVERVKVDQAIPATLNKRARRKLHMAELGRERMVMDSLEPVPGDLQVDAGILSEDILLPEELPPPPANEEFSVRKNKWQPGSLKNGDEEPVLAYTPEALLGFMDTMSDGRRTMWDYELIFGADLLEPYYLELITRDGIPMLRLEYEDPNLVTGVNYFLPDDLHWVSGGLAIEDQGGEGWFLPTTHYCWQKKATPVRLKSWGEDTDEEEPKPVKNANSAKVKVGQKDQDGDVVMDGPAPHARTKSKSPTKQPSQPTRSSPRKQPAPLPQSSAKEAPAKAASPPAKAASPVRPSSPVIAPSPAKAASPTKVASPSKPRSPVKAESPPAVAETEATPANPPAEPSAPAELPESEAALPEATVSGSAAPALEPVAEATKKVEATTNTEAPKEADTTMEAEATKEARPAESEVTNGVDKTEKLVETLEPMETDEPTAATPQSVPIDAAPKEAEAPVVEAKGPEPAEPQPEIPVETSVEKPTEPAQQTEELTTAAAAEPEQPVEKPVEEPKEQAAPEQLVEQPERPAEQEVVPPTEEAKPLAEPASEPAKDEARPQDENDGSEPMDMDMDMDIDEPDEPAPAPAAAPEPAQAPQAEVPTTEPAARPEPAILIDSYRRPEHSPSAAQPSPKLEDTWKPVGKMKAREPDEGSEEGEIREDFDAAE